MSDPNMNKEQLTEALALHARSLNALALVLPSKGVHDAHIEIARPVVEAAREHLACNTVTDEMVEAAMGGFYRAVDGFWNSRHTDFIKLPLLSQDQSTAFLVRKGLEAALEAALRVEET